MRKPVSGTIRELKSPPAVLVLSDKTRLLVSNIMRYRVESGIPKVVFNLRDGSTAYHDLYIEGGDHPSQVAAAEKLVVRLDDLLGGGAVLADLIKPQA